MYGAERRSKRSVQRCARARPEVIGEGAGTSGDEHPHGEDVYVIEGEMIFELEGEPERVVRAGETFWEPGGDVVHYQMSNLDAGGWSSFLAVCICAPGVDMITMLGPQEIAARDSLRHPSARRHAD